MVLTAAVEFNPELSKLVPSRPSDDVELSKIITSKALPHAHVKTKERIFNLPYAIKSRILLHSHVERVAVHSSFLESGMWWYGGHSPAELGLSTEPCSQVYIVLVASFCIYTVLPT